MTHKDAGHFAEKHPAGTTVAPEVEHELGKRINNGEISCAAAHAVAIDLKVSPEQIGIAIDLQETRLHKCQLGLFGHGKGRKAVQPADSVSPELEAAISAVLIDGRLACRAAWRIAVDLDVPKMTVANACERLGIRIKPCQLGAF